MKILALDAATKTGWAYNRKANTTAGLWELKSKDKSNGERLRKLVRRLDLLHKMQGVDLLVLEEFNTAAVGHHAKLVLGGIRGVIDLWVYDNKIPLKLVKPTEVKKHALRRGRAGKELMLMSARKKWPHLQIVDDNVADALWILDFAMKQINQG